MITTLIIVLALAAELFWVVQLLDLMSRTDREFPGRYDKLTWALILLLANIIGAIVFLIAKPSKQPNLFFNKKP